MEITDESPAEERDAKETSYDNAARFAESSCQIRRAKDHNDLTGSLRHPQEESFQCSVLEPFDNEGGELYVVSKRQRIQIKSNLH